jgi:hypothetical protein
MPQVIPGVAGMNKHVSALFVGVSAGFLASAIVFLKGLDMFEIASYFVFWISISLIWSFMYPGKRGWLKGLLLAEIFAVPIILLTIGSYPGGSLTYIILNIVLINAFIGIAVGYFNGLSVAELPPEAEYSEDILKKIAIAVLSGFGAFLVNLIPITLNGEGPFLMVGNLVSWLAMSVIISLSSVKLKSWLTGFIIAELVALPVALVFLEHNLLSGILTLLATGLLGAALGAFIGKYAKAVIVKYN